MAEPVDKLSAEEKEDKMIIRGCKSISEYAFRRWMAGNGFADRYFTLEVDGNKGVIMDKNGDTLHLIYDSAKRCVDIDRDCEEA